MATPPFICMTASLLNAPHVSWNNSAFLRGSCSRRATGHKKRKPKKKKKKMNFSKKCAQATVITQLGRAAISIQRADRYEILSAAAQRICPSGCLAARRARLGGSTSLPASPSGKKIKRLQLEINVDWTKNKRIPEKVSEFESCCCEGSG